MKILIAIIGFTLGAWAGVGYTRQALADAFAHGEGRTICERILEGAQ